MARLSLPSRERTVSFTVPTPAVLVAAPQHHPTSRQVRATVRGVPLTVDCPDWCTDDHSEDLRDIEDLVHSSGTSHVLVPQFAGGAEVSLQATLIHYPFGSDSGNRPYLGLTDDGSCETAALGRVAALAFADQLVAHAARICEMAESLPA